MVSDEIRLAVYAELDNMPDGSIWRIPEYLWKKSENYSDPASEISRNAIRHALRVAINGTKTPEVYVIGTSGVNDELVIKRMNDRLNIPKMIEKIAQQKKYLLSASSMLETYGDSLLVDGQYQTRADYEMAKKILRWLLVQDELNKK